MLNRKTAILMALCLMGALSAVASVPSQSFTVPGMGSAPSSLDQDMTEIRAKRQADLRVDNDLGRLTELRGRYRENLPLSGNRTASRKAAPSVRTSQSSAVRAKPAPKSTAKPAKKAKKPQARASLKKSKSIANAKSARKTKRL